jgi:hypothetical protein
VGNVRTSGGGDGNSDGNFEGDDEESGTQGGGNDPEADSSLLMVWKLYILI